VAYILSYKVIFIYNIYLYLIFKLYFNIFVKIIEKYLITLILKINLILFVKVIIKYIKIFNFKNKF